MGKYFTRQEAIETLIKTLDGYTEYYEDLHHEAFNSDYYMIYTDEAERALTQYDVWEALSIVREYEQSNFGEVYTDISDPCQLANMLWYIIGENLIYDIEELYEVDGQADDETNERLIEVLKAELDKEDE